MQHYSRSGSLDAVIENDIPHRPLKSCLSVPYLRGLDTTSSPSKNIGSKSPHLTRNVSFCQIEIREYEQTLVNNPSVTSGPALGLDWTYNPKAHVFDLEEYEVLSDSRRRSKAQMIMPRSYRETKLKQEWDITSDQMKQMNRKMAKTRKQRIASINNPDAVEKTLDVLHGVKRKLKRFLVRKPTTQTYNGEQQQQQDLKLTTMMSKRCVSMNDLNMYEPVSPQTSSKRFVRSDTNSPLAIEEGYENEGEGEREINNADTNTAQHKTGETSTVDEMLDKREETTCITVENSDDDWGFGFGFDEEEEVIPS